MKIIHILNHVRDCGNGIVCATIDLACEQAKLGHKVFVISGGGEFSNLLKAHGVVHITANQRRKPFIILKALISINKRMQEIKPDIVHAHMMTSVIIAKVLKIFHCYKLISTIHNEFQRSVILMGLADKIISVSAGVKETMIKRGISEKKLYVVRNGTISSVREEKDGNASSQIILNRPSITTVAGLYERKGITCLIKAFEIIKRDIPDAHLYIIGEGPDRLKFEEQAKSTGNEDSIHFEGFQQRPKNYLNQTDVFVLASTTENFGLALSEARGAGCSVFGSSVGGIPEVLEFGKAGQLSASENYQELADLIIKTISNPKLLLDWKNRAKTHTEWLSVKRVCAETLDIYLIK